VVLQQRFQDSSCLIQHDASHYLPSMPHTMTSYCSAQRPQTQCSEKLALLTYFNISDVRVYGGKLKYCLLFSETTQKYAHMTISSCFPVHKDDIFFLWLYSSIQALATSMKLSVSLQLLYLGPSVGLLGRVISSS
jgi:hypothetical protein